MEPEEKALLVGLVRVILAVPVEQWGVSDRQCLGTLLQQAIGAGGLSGDAKAAAREVSSVVDECGSSVAPGILDGQVKGSCLLNITAQVPTVSLWTLHPPSLEEDG